MSTLIVVVLVVLAAAAIVLIAVRPGLMITLALLLARLLAGFGLILLARIVIGLVVLIAIVLIGHESFLMGCVIQPFCISAQTSHPVPRFSCKESRQIPRLFAR
jgi:hypothetical protein